MTHSPFKSLIWLFFLTLALILCNKYILNNLVSSYAVRTIEKPLAYAYANLGFVRNFVSNVSSINDLTNENIRLKEKNQELIGQIAEMDFYEQENKYLREAFNLSVKNSWDFISGNVYSLSLSAGGYSASLNRGRKDGVEVDQVVIAPSGALIGKIQEISEYTAKVMTVLDPRFSVNIKIMGTSTVGLAKGNLDDGMLLDLITQADQVKEGDLIVSSGSDIFPSGFVVGTVKHVDINSTDIFKKVRIDTQLFKLQLGQVMIIKR